MQFKSTGNKREFMSFGFTTGYNRFSVPLKGMGIWRGNRQEVVQLRLQQSVAEPLLIVKIIQIIVNIERSQMARASD